MKRIIALILILAIAGCKQSFKKHETQKQDKEEIVENFISLVKNDVNDDNINGSISLAIIHKDSTLASETFGPGDKNTIYRIGSITKSFTGFLILQLQEEGKLNLNDEVEKYVPEIKSVIDYSNYEPITLKQLASHTSGLARESRNREMNHGISKNWEEILIKGLPETSFRFKPGKRFAYSNIGYAILGLAISRAANKAYTALVHEKILIPLGMDNTYFELPEHVKKNLAKGMAGGPTAELNFELPRREHKGRGYRVPNGGIYSTSEDMAKFIKACMGYSAILNKNSVKILQTTQTPSTRSRANYSFGFTLYADQDIHTVGHGGSTPGYSAHFEFEKNSQYGLVMLRNYNFGNTNLDLRSNSLIRKLSLEE